MSDLGWGNTPSSSRPWGACGEPQIKQHINCSCNNVMEVVVSTAKARTVGMMVTLGSHVLVQMGTLGSQRASLSEQEPD